MIRSLVRPNLYQDSVNLMLLSTRLRELPGVREAAVMMGTPLNKDRYREAGLLTREIAAAGPNDLCIAVAAEAEAAIAAALAAAEAFFRAPQRAVAGGAGVRPRTLESAVRQVPQADLALISVPGEYAAAEAERALRRGLHVFLFSDNVPLEAEVRLKRLAAERGLLCMGPDCGTAIVAGLPLGFANRVPGGSVGLVGAAGTGLQEVACLLARRGAGISHVLGTGGRDLGRAVGGRTFLSALRGLAADPKTEVLVLVSKPPEPAVEAEVLAEVARIGKPTVVAFIGGRPEAARAGGAIGVETLAEAAAAAAALARGEAWAGRGLPDVEAIHAGWLAEARRRLGPGPRFVRGLYAGGTLADEAALILGRCLPGVSALTAMPGVARLADPTRSAGHAVVDLGEDVFTSGRPHPMIDPTLRIDRLRHEAEDPEVAVLLLDVVLGYGAHPDPAGALALVIRAARAGRRAKGGELAVIASVVGTDEDPQGYGKQRAILEEAGARVADSNAEAALLAAALVAGTARSGAAGGRDAEAERGRSRPMSEAPADRGQRIASLLEGPRAIVNLGLESFVEALLPFGVPVVQVDWRPPAGGDPELLRLLRSVGGEA
jgi:FdrA protein